MDAEKKEKLEAELGRINIISVKHQRALAEIKKRAEEIVAELSKE